MFILITVNKICIFLFIISYFYTKIIFQAISILSISSNKKLLLVATLLLDKEKEAANIWLLLSILIVLFLHYKHHPIVYLSLALSLFHT